MEYGKFETAEELLKGYNELEKAFTKKCQELNELVEKIKDGKYVELPCKVGDEVFYVCGGNIETYIVKMVGCDQEGWYFTVDDEDHYEHYFDDESIIGVTVFFERDKAEAKLKELKGENE